MITEEQFQRKWSYMSKMQRKYCIEYLKCLDIREAAANAGYTGVCVTRARHKVFRKVQDVIEYLVAKNNVVSSLVRPQWVLNEYRKLFNQSTDKQLKLKCLQDFAKILKLQNGDSQLTVVNNMPQTPVVIKFKEKDE